VGRWQWVKDETLDDAGAERVVVGEVLRKGSSETLSENTSHEGLIE